MDTGVGDDRGQAVFARQGFNNLDVSASKFSRQTADAPPGGAGGFSKRVVDNKDLAG